MPVCETSEYFGAEIEDRFQLNFHGKNQTKLPAKIGSGWGQS